MSALRGWGGICRLIGIARPLPKTRNCTEVCKNLEFTNYLLHDMR